MRNNSNSSAVRATKLIEADPHKRFCGTVVHCEEGCGSSAQACEAALVFLSTQSIHMSSSATAMNSPAAFDIPLAAIPTWTGWIVIEENSFILVFFFAITLRERVLEIHVKGVPNPLLRLSDCSFWRSNWPVRARTMNLKSAGNTQEFTFPSVLPLLFQMIVNMQVGHRGMIESHQSACVLF